MKKFGFWLLKHNIHIMTAIFPGWAIVVINRNIDYPGILAFIAGFICL